MHTLRMPQPGGVAVRHPAPDRWGLLWRWAPLAALAVSAAFVAVGWAAGTAQRDRDAANWSEVPAEVLNVDLAVDADNILRANAKVRTVDGAVAVVREWLTARAGDRISVWQDPTGEIFTPSTPGDEPLTNPARAARWHLVTGAALIAVTAAARLLRRHRN